MNRDFILSALDGADTGLLNRFIAYHEKNPHVFDAFYEAAKLIKASGRKKYGARTIIETIRWRQDLVTVSNDFKINDHYSCLYGRLVSAWDNSFEGFFNKRSLSTHQSSLEAG